VSAFGLDPAWAAIEGGASLSEACRAADVRGAARGPLLEDLRRLLAGEARLEKVAPKLRTPWRRLVALRVLDGEEVGERELAQAGVDAAALRRHAAVRLERATPIQRLALRGSVRPPVAAALLESLGDEAEAFLAASWRAAPTVLRVNVARTTREALAERLAAEGLATEPGRWSPWALVVQNEGPLPATRAFDEGLFEVQDEASQLVARIVDPPRNAPVVDACAGAGGKTLALCAALGTRGRVIALDPSKRRLDALKRRAARAQAFNLLVRPTPIEGAPLEPALADVAGRAARVLIDAPCSGLGSLRRKPDLARRIDVDLLARLPDQQLAIACAAVRWLRPGGRLLLATCTPLRAENEAVVERLVVAEGLRPLPVHAWLPPDLAALDPGGDATVLRLLPHRHGTDAFTVHVLERPG
jgi:16S rRNA (cytosine967-C5)-methyltransferase